MALQVVGSEDEQGAQNAAEMIAAALDRGVWLRPFRDLLYTMPPYVTADADLAVITEAVVAAARVPSSRAGA